MDPFLLIIGGGTLGMVVALFLIGLWAPGSGADQLDWKPTRSPEQEVQNEIDDLAQMLEAANARRRRKGRAELTEDSVQQDIRRDTFEAHQRRDRYVADQEIAQMIEAKNVRRRRRGLPDLTEEQFRAQLAREGR